ncbi:acylglycerol kinase-like protein Mulk isoform X2 [Rhodnius prolixus]|uniref:acylglycerol kinase-like protein Mulk isoform X2 n=1 Tax=Rhodnius prolixus TaxID=13249 RepID=UPI003D18D894
MVKIFLTIRNNWKKSLFGAGVITYGINYAINHYRMLQMMRAYCEEAVKYGDTPAIIGQPRKITVVLNPAANKRKAKKLFEKYCAPILYLSGAYVSIVETEREGHAREIIDKIDPNTSAVVIAGGDGTLSENEDSSINEGKPVYGIGKVEWGLRRELKRRSESFWYLGPFKKYASLVFPGTDLHTDPTAQYQSKGLISAKLRYTAPCKGCSSCCNQRPDLIKTLSITESSSSKSSKWWNILSLKNRRAAQHYPVPDNEIDYNSIVNEACSTVEEKVINTSDLCVTTASVDAESVDEDTPHILLKIGPRVKNQGEIILHGIKLFKEENSIVVDRLKAKQLEIRPISADVDLLNVKEHKKELKEDCLSIDNEDYEVRPIKVTLLPNSVKVFCP